MAYAQSYLHAEIQTLRDALSASEKKADRYAQMSATWLSDLLNCTDSDHPQLQRFLLSWTTFESVYVTPAGRS